jgi:hypothetical protein
MEYVKHELARGLDDWEQRLNTALVKSSPTDLVRAPGPAPSSRTASPAGAEPSPTGTTASAKARR